MYFHVIKKAQNPSSCVLDLFYLLKFFLSLLIFKHIFYNHFRLFTLCWKRISNGKDFLYQQSRAEVKVVSGETSSVALLWSECVLTLNLRKWIHCSSRT